MITQASADPMALMGSPINPPDEWFAGLPDDFNPVFDPTQPLVRVYTAGPDTGRFVALVAPLASCLLNGSEAKGRCITPPPDGSGFDFAHIGTTVLASGAEIRTSIVPGELSHASKNAPWKVAIDHYANTGASKARVRYFVDEKRGGIFAAGAMHPIATVWDGIVAQASALSGDWRWIDELEQWRMIASQLVNVPGFRPAERRAPTTASCSISMVASAGRMELHWESSDAVQIASVVRAILASPRHFSAKQREEMASKNIAMKDGSFPIPDRGALRRAIQAYGRASDQEAAKQHIIQRARALNATEFLPEGWA